MSQEAFGERLGVSRSVIKNLELNALSRPDQKLSLIRLMCREFNINEDWLLNGNGPIDAPSELFSFDDFFRDHGATDIELSILKAYFELDPKIRNLVMDHFISCISSQNLCDDYPDNPDELCAPPDSGSNAC